jgi:hypothetical protein
LLYPDNKFINQLDKFFHAVKVNIAFIAEGVKAAKDYFLPRTQYYMARSLSSKMF